MGGIVSFVLKPNLCEEEREHAIELIRSLSGVRGVDLERADTLNALADRIGYARVADDADPADLAAVIASLEGIASA